MKTLIYFCFGLISFTCLAQGREYNYFIRQTKIPDDGNNKIVINDRKDTTLVSHYVSQDVVSNTYREFTKIYKGTPFFMNGWYRGKITTKFDTDLSALMAYNIQKGLVYLVGDPRMEAAALKPVEFSLENHTFKLFGDKYFEVIHDGKIKILKEYTCSFYSFEPTQRTGYEPEGSNDYNGEFKKFFKYYFLEGEKIVEITSNKKLYKQLGSQKEQIENYIKSNKLNASKEIDLVSIFKYYETL